MDNFDSLIFNNMEIVYRLQGLHPTGSAVDTAAEHCEGAQRMVDMLVHGRLPWQRRENSLAVQLQTVLRMITTISTPLTA
jgi:hypothetical protein